MKLKRKFNGHTTANMAHLSSFAPLVSGSLDAESVETVVQHFHGSSLARQAALLLLLHLLLALNTFLFRRPLQKSFCVRHN